MTKRAVVSFDVTGWDQSPHEGDGPLHSRGTVKKTFRGELAAESTAELLMCQVDAKDLAAGAGYVASETVTGTLEGRAGTFVMQHWGLSGGDTPPRTGGHIVPGSGTGDLAGITGSVEISVDADGAHALILEYDLP